MEQSFLPLHDLPFFVYYDPLDDLHVPGSNSIDTVDDASFPCLAQPPPPQHHISRAPSVSILPSATPDPFSFPNMSSTGEQPTAEAAETVAPTRSSSRAPDASSSSGPHPYAHARTNKPSPRDRVRALQAEDEDEDHVKKLKSQSKHKRTKLVSPEVFDKQPKAILDPNGVPYALGVAALESHYTAMKTGEKELPNPYVHRHQRDRERRRARRHEPPAKPTPEQTALSKYRDAYLCYDDEYREEILTYMYKCIVRPSESALNI